MPRLNIGNILYGVYTHSIVLYGWRARELRNVRV